MFSFRKIFKYVWPQMKKYRLSFFIVFFAYGVATLLDNILKPYIYKEIIDSIVSGSDANLILARIINFALWVALIILTHQVLYRVGDYANAYFESKTMKGLYDYTFDKLLMHSYSFFSNNFSGSIVAKTKRFARSFEIFQDTLSFQIWFSLVNIAGILFVLFIKVPLLGFIFLAWSIIYIFITVLFTRKKIVFDVRKAAADSVVTGKLADVLTNILNIKIFSGRREEREKFRLVTTDEETKRREAWYFGNLQNVFQALLMAILQIAVLFMNIHFWYVGKMSVGTFVLIQTYMMGLFDILWNLGRSLSRMAGAFSDMKEITDILDLEPDILDVPNPEQCRISAGRINFNDITFEYVEGLRVFKNFNLEIKPGEKVGLVGHSGSGKSTITRLLLRFSDIKEGNILDLPEPE